jgi:ABC-type antimicrobial peptide transport system permease subunit
VRIVVTDAARPIVAGLLAGLGGALAAAPALRSVLFGVEPVAAGPFALVAATLLAAGIIASVTAALPIRRIDPLEALRTE